MWRTWKWWTQWWLYEKGAQIKKPELFPLQFGLAYYKNMEILCYFLRVRFRVKKPDDWGGWRNTTQRSLMFLDELARKYVINFILYLCTSYFLLWKGKVVSSLSKGFFNVDDRYRDGKTNCQALTWMGFVVHFWSNSMQPPLHSKFNKR